MSTAINHISTEQFITRSEGEDKLLIVDVRTRAEVNNEYLEGCCELPLQELTESAFAALVKNNNSADNEPVYLLCGSGQRARLAAQQLAGKSSSPLIIIEGGINALKQAGVHLKRGHSSVISLERQVRIAAGVLVILGVLLGFFVNPLGFGLSAFVGAGLAFAGITDTCAMGMALARLPWNQAS